MLDSIEYAVFHRFVFCFLCLQLENKSYELKEFASSRFWKEFLSVTGFSRSET
ncbi:MAG: hypothetical protein LBJ67_02165 [Planctomycetaceae bacterium]|jgi:hypothetical protein|nr:hypothetical protein [Planctomycetaceae bacterium]